MNFSTASGDPIIRSLECAGYGHFIQSRMLHGVYTERERLLPRGQVGVCLEAQKLSQLMAFSSQFIQSLLQQCMCSRFVSKSACLTAFCREHAVRTNRLDWAHAFAVMYMSLRMLGSPIHFKTVFITWRSVGTRSTLGLVSLRSHADRIPCGSGRSNFSGTSIYSRAVNIVCWNCMLNWVMSFCSEITFLRPWYDK